MKLLLVNDYPTLSHTGADIVSATVNAKPDAVLGLTTGNTPVGLYQELALRCQEKKLSLEKTRIFCTEEYLGVGPADPCGLFSWLQRLLVLPCAIPPAQVFRLRGDDNEPQLACQDFEHQIERCGGLDLVVESIGTNGHIGFNEPNSPFTAPTRIVALTEETLHYNEQYWHNPVPRYGLTIGLETLQQARHIVLLVSGVAKAEALAQALEGPVTSAVPASILQQCTQVTIIADRAAASLLHTTEETDDV